MRFQRPLLILMAVVAVASAYPHAAICAHPADSTTQPAPPVATVNPVTDEYYGTKVVDPYRYMENLQDPQVQAWIKAQADYTRNELANIPGRAHLLERIREFDLAVPKVQAQLLPGDVYIISKRLPGEDVSKLYLRHGLAGEDQ